MDDVLYTGTFVEVNTTNSLINYTAKDLVSVVDDLFGWEWKQATNNVGMQKIQEVQKTQEKGIHMAKQDSQKIS